MIEIANLQFGYKRKTPLFNSMELTFEPGIIYGLLGRNGAGKTSLLKIIAGLLFPKLGKCSCRGVDTAKRIPGVLEEIFMLPEVSYLPPVKITEFIEIYSPFYSRYKHESFLDYLEKFELSLNENISNISYGQKKKLAIAFAFSVDSRVLLLDEPTNGLDIPAKSAFRKIVSSFMSPEKSLIVSTHQIRDMKNLIEQILIIENGGIIFNHNISEIESNLSVSIQQNLPEVEEVVYFEKVFSGYSVLSRKSDNDCTDIDLEFLFNAVLTKSKEINNLMAGEEK